MSMRCVFVILRVCRERGVCVCVCERGVCVVIVKERE